MRLPLIAFFLLFSLSISAQQGKQDTLVLFSEIVYNSSAEKEAFENFFFENENNYFDLFTVINSELSANNIKQKKIKHNAVLNKIGDLKLEGKSPEKRIKLIYKKVHEGYLKKYELKNNFSDIYVQGYYNCVSATALYGMVFESNNIPYTIKETPTHVYLVAFPNTNRIKVETTDPNNGYYAFSSAFKTDFIERMKSGKLISEDEFKENNINVLFDKYYFTEEDISLKELVGIQYSNDALYLIDGNKNKEAFVQLEKAFLFYPVEKVRFLLTAICAQIVTKSDYSDSTDIDYLVKLNRIKNANITAEVILGEWSRALNNVLVDKNNIDLIKKHHYKLSNSLKSKELKMEVDYYYYYERGRLLYNQGKYKESLLFIEKAYETKPDNHDINRLFVSNIAQMVRSKTTGNTLELLEGYASKYEAIKQNDNFNNMLMFFYLQHVVEQTELGEIAEAHKYIVLFEDKHSKTENINIERHVIGRAYSLLAIYYFKRGQKSKAKSIINKGLELAPNNYELLQRRRMMNY